MDHVLLSRAVSVGISTSYLPYLPLCHMASLRKARAEVFELTYGQKGGDDINPDGGESRSTTSRVAVARWPDIKVSTIKSRNLPSLAAPKVGKSRSWLQSLCPTLSSNAPSCTSRTHFAGACQVFLEGQSRNQLQT